MEPWLERWRPTPAVAAALGSGVVLARMAAPTVTDRDAGELAAAAFNLDVAHPTGFVVDMVLLRLAALAPVGDVAFRMNLCVAALGALACGLAASVASRFAEGASPLSRWSCALAPAAVMVGSSTLVRAWTAVEVYASVVAAALAAVALLADGARPEAERRRLVAALAGVSLLSLHTSARPAAALALAALTLRGARSLDAKALARRALPVFALGASTLPLVMWLVVASRRDGPVDWGDPETPRALAAHLSAASIRAAYAGRMLVAWRLPEDVARAGMVIWEDLGPLPIALGLAGVALAARSRVALVLAGVGAVDLAYAIAVNPMGITDRQTFFHLEAALCLLAVAPCALLAVRLTATRWRDAPAVLATAMALAALARRDVSWEGAADGWVAPEVLGGAGALGAVPPRALVLCASDDLCGVSLYAQHVEGERPDVTVLPRQHLAFPWTWRRIDARRLGESVAPTGRDGDPSAGVSRTHALLSRLGDRVRWEGGAEGEHPSVGARWRFGSGETPLLAVPGAPVTDVDRGAASWVGERMPRLPGAGARWVGAMVTFAAGARVARGGIQDAVPLWLATIALDPDHVSAYTNLGVAAARRGALGEAAAFTRAALAIDPERPVAWRNLRDFLLGLGDEGGAREAEREYLRRR